MLNYYRYRGQPLTPKITESLILTLFPRAPKIKKEYIVKGVLQFHKSQDGLDPNGPIDQYIAHALENLSKKGYAENIEHSYWSILSIYDYDLEL